MRASTSASRSCARSESMMPRSCSMPSARSQAPTEELAALRDKANLALGYAWLKADRPADAKRVLQRVRLEGPQSNKALLGVGLGGLGGASASPRRSSRGSSCAAATCSTLPCRSRISRFLMRTRSSMRQTGGGAVHAGSHGVRARKRSASINRLPPSAAAGCSTRSWRTTRPIRSAGIGSCRICRTRPRRDTSITCSPRMSSRKA